MVDRIVLLAAATALLTPAVAAGAVPAPMPTTSPLPALKVIANVRSTPRCAEIVAHANTAISSALNNDAVILQTITRLRAVNLDDGNPIHRRNGLDALGDLAKTLMMQSRSADDEVKRLRKLAKESSDPQEQRDLKAFADELGGALWRQQTIARDLNGYLAAVDFRDMTAWDESQQNMNKAVFGVPDPLIALPTDVAQGANPRNPNPPLTPSTVPHLGHGPQPTATQQAQAAARDFQRRMAGIGVDEGDAASHVDGAIKGC